MVRSAAERAFLPTRNLLEEIGDMMILTGRTIWSALRPPYPYGGEFVVAVPVRAAALLVSAAGLHGLPVLRRAGTAGRELLRNLRCAGSHRRASSCSPRSARSARA